MSKEEKECLEAVESAASTAGECLVVSPVETDDMQTV